MTEIQQDIQKDIQKDIQQRYDTADTQTKRSNDTQKNLLNSEYLLTPLDNFGELKVISPQMSVRDDKNIIHL